MIRKDENNKIIKLIIGIIYGKTEHYSLLCQLKILV